MSVEATRRPRVFVGPTEIAGYYGQLATGLREIGVDAEFVPLSHNPFTFEAEMGRFRIPAIMRWARGPQGTRLDGWFAKVFLRPLLFPLRLAFLVQAALRFDVFIFGFGQTILRQRWPVDLWVLKRLGRRIILVFNGTDSRAPWLSALPEGNGDHRQIRKLANQTEKRARRIWALESFADVVVVNPLSAQLHRKRAVDWFRIGIPQQVPASCDAAPQPSDGALIAVHAPSRPEAKGTHEIRKAIEELNEDGVAIELVELQGQPNRVVLDTLRRCDFVVDQCYADTPMAGFASEAASLGRPAIVGGYELDHLVASLPEADVPPTIRCRPEDLKRAIRSLAEDPERRIETGRRAHAFLRERWHRKAVASRFKKLIDGDVPDHWWFDPGSCGYHLGLGASKDRRRAVVRAMVDRFGPSSLSIDDKPELRDAILTWAGMDRPAPDSQPRGVTGQVSTGEQPRPIALPREGDTSRSP